MATEILGISGSPIPNSNTDQAIKAVLEATGMVWEFVKLSDLTMQPCRACLGCKDSNTCVVKDDAQELAGKFRAAKGFVLGGYTPYSSLDGRTKTFMERMYCLRHQTGLNRGKPGVAVLTTACNPTAEGLPPASQIATQQIAFWMMEEGMNNLGTMVLIGNVPCIRCGYGDQCEMSGVKMLHGPAATVQSVGVQKFSLQQTVQQQAKELGERLRQAAGAK